MTTEAAFFSPERLATHAYALQKSQNRIGINSRPLLILGILQHPQKTLCPLFPTCDKGLKQQLLRTVFDLESIS